MIGQYEGAAFQSHLTSGHVLRDRGRKPNARGTFPGRVHAARSNGCNLFQQLARDIKLGKTLLPHPKGNNTRFFH